MAIVADEVKGEAIVAMEAVNIAVAINAPSLDAGSRCMTNLKSRILMLPQISVGPETASVTIGNYGNPRAADRYEFNRRTGELTLSAPYASAVEADKLRGWIYSIHIGSLGGFVTRLLWLLSSLLGASLPLTAWGQSAFRLLRYGLDLLHVKAPVLGSDVFQIVAPLDNAANAIMAAFIHPPSENAILLAPRGSLGCERKTVFLPCVDDMVGRAGAIFTCRKIILGVKLRFPDVVQRLILRADLLHALGKLADVVVTIPNCRVVLVDKPTYPFSRFPVRGR